DDDDQHSPRPAAARCRHGHGARPEPWRHRRPPRHRCDAPGERRAGDPHGARAHRAVLGLLPVAARLPRSDQARGARRSREAALREAFRRAEAAAPVRTRDLRQPRAPVPRRADGRHGHRGAPADVDGHPRPRERGAHDPADDALPGGSRLARRSHRRAVPGAARRGRDAGGHQGAGRRPDRPLPHCAARRRAGGAARRARAAAAPCRRGARGRCRGAAAARAARTRPGAVGARSDQRRTRRRLFIAHCGSGGRRQITGDGMMTILVREIRAHFLAMVRAPMFAIPTILFPAMFYIFFGLTFSKSWDLRAPTWMLATYGTFGIMGPALFGFGVGIAVEKGEGWLRLKRAAPVSPFVPLLARAAMAMLFAFIVFAMLASLGALFGHVRMG